MTIQLAQNIRALRKSCKLTQEQLSQALGVTAGAVYKWEAGLSLPELSLIVELADFFDTSVDVLLGYEMKDNKQEATVERLKKSIRDKDGNGLAEAEKALQKYPNSFAVVYNGARLYRLFGMELQDKEKLNRALGLLEQALTLLSQNSDPHISALTIYGDMAEVYIALGKEPQAIALLQKHNAKGIFSDLIGLTLASEGDRRKEALPYLSEALLYSLTSLVRTLLGFVNLYFGQEDYLTACDLLDWAIRMLSGLKKEGEGNFLDKIEASLFVCLGHAQNKLGRTGIAKQSLGRAKTLAQSFDKAPSYRVDGLRFIAPETPVGIYDDLGATAMAGVEKTLASCEDESLWALWKELWNHEN